MIQERQNFQILCEGFSFEKCKQKRLTKQILFMVALKLYVLTISNLQPVGFLVECDTHLMSFHLNETQESPRGNQVIKFGHEKIERKKMFKRKSIVSPKMFLVSFAGLTIIS